MAKLVMDTSTWLDLAKPRLEEILIELEQLVHNGTITLLTCDIIIEEWDRNRDRILKEVVDSIRSHVKSAKKFADLIPEPDKTAFKDLIDKHSNKIIEEEKLAKNFFDRVETLLKKSEVYSIDDSVKVKMADKAVAKLAPFHNSKNNMADALLLSGAIAHVEKNTFARDLIFVSSNKSEFGDPSNYGNMHPQLKADNIHFHTNLATALEMSKEAIEIMEDEYTEHLFQSWLDSYQDTVRGK